LHVTFGIRSPTRINDMFSRRARSEGAFSAPIENNSERRNPQEVEDMFVTSQIPDPMMHQLKDQEILVDRKLAMPIEKKTLAP
jgi:hypothetical protein